MIAKVAIDLALDRLFTYEVPEALQKKIAEEYGNNIVEDITTVEDLTQLYVIRTQTGNGPVIFVTGVKSDEGRHEIRRWYSYQHKVNYFQVRECSYEYWANHPETQDSTN